MSKKTIVSSGSICDLSREIMGVTWGKNKP